MSTQVVFFDLGGVLYHAPNLAWIKRWQKIIGLKSDPFLESFFSSRQDSALFKDVMVGKVPEAHVWEMVARRWKISPTFLERMRRGALSEKRWNKELAKFVASLRPRYRTAILSNASSESRHTFNNAFQLDRLVDQEIFSAEEKVAKPDERIYQIALDRFGIQPQEAVFIDDLPENVEAGRRFGINAIQYIDTAQAIADIQHLLD
jgi:epoxide hydrolase-like predicted phosphatase